MRFSQANLARTVLATSLLARLLGLLPKNVCANGESLLLAPCRSIHSFGMVTKLDIAFISKDSQVLAVERNLPPGKLRSHRRAVAVLERRSRPDLPWLKAGDRLSLAADTSICTQKPCDCAAACQQKPSTIISKRSKT